MNSGIKFFIGLFLGITLAVSVTVLAAQVPLSRDDGVNYVRAPIPKAGHPTQLAVSAASAASAELTERVVYCIICDVNVYIEYGDDSAPTADSNSGYLPSNSEKCWTAWADRADYVAVLEYDTGVTGTCYATENE